MQRRLTVIFAADVVGYTALMAGDEAGTLALLKANRRNVFDPQVQAHGGRIVKLMGDGALVEFGSVVAAVTCAHEIQRATDGDGSSIRYRIGITLGEVIVEGDDIYGDGVNIAARLQVLAAPGGVALSRAAHDQVVGKIPVAFEDLGNHTVKDNERPVHVFALCVAAAGAPSLAPVTPSRQRCSICVLPFANMSGDPEQEYFSDGITEDIITDLSKVSALSVVSRNTAFTFKGKRVEIAQVARQLKVSHVLEGSVRKAGNRVRITAQLIDGETDSHLWAERYDRDLNDIFALQDEISEAIVAALKLKLLPSEKVAIEHRSTTNPEAYKLYLMAKQYNATGDSRHREITVRLCQRAIEIDPDYARAWALLAICQSNRFLLVTQSGDTGWDAALRALSIAPNLAEAHAAKGRILGDAGHYEEALAEHRVALELDPEAYEVNAAAARTFIATRRFDDAIACLERAARAIETDFWALGMLVQCHSAKGDPAAAKATARRALERVERVIVAQPDHLYALGFGVTSLLTLGETDRAREWVARAKLLDPDNTNLSYNLACGMSMHGAVDDAIELIKVVFRSTSQQGMNWFEIDTDLDPIRDDPRFKAMMAEAKARLAGAGSSP